MIEWMALSMEEPAETGSGSCMMSSVLLCPWWTRPPIWLLGTTVLCPQKEKNGRDGFLSFRLVWAALCFACLLGPVQPYASIPCDVFFLYFVNFSVRFPFYKTSPEKKRFWAGIQSSQHPHSGQCWWLLCQHLLEAWTSGRLICVYMSSKTRDSAYPGNPGWRWGAGQHTG